MLKLIISVVFFSASLSGCNSQEKEASSNITAESLLELSRLDPFRQNVTDSLKYLLPILDSVLYYDQKYRVGNDVKKMSDNKEIVRAIDSSNVIIVSGILDKYGFLDINDIGMTGYTTIAIIIIHARIDVQIKYLPLFKKAIADKKKILPSHYAMLEDKISVHQKKLQTFGTQVILSGKKSKGDVWPLISPDSVDIRRKSIGMAEAMAAYLIRFDIKWDLEKYKKQLPKLKEKYGVKD